MRVPLSWLCEYCDPGLGTADVVERLAMTGTEVERVERVDLGEGGEDGAGAGDEVEEVLELEVTPNRPDCLSVYGVARELHAATGAPLGEDPCARDAEPSGDDSAADHCALEIADPEVCLRFTARAFDGVKVGRSPRWLAARLYAAGQRPISNVVDVTNYAMLATGQPMHAFDLDRVRGGRIVVRRAGAGERIVTLDGEEYALDGSMAVVCDAEGPSGIAGIKGGQVSEVSDSTTRVLMEAATWVGPNVLQTSKRLGLRSDASTRFEKQLHPDGALAAQRLAARLMVEVCGARLVPGTLDAYPRPAEPRTLELRLGRMRSLLGEEVPADEVRAILARLGFGVAEGGGGDGGDSDGDSDGERLSVLVPWWRDADVQREADLVEEVARIYGLEKLPVTLPARERAVGGLTPAQRLRRRLEDALRDRGLSEVVGWSFTSPGAIERLRLGGDGGDGTPLLRLANPLSEEQSVMRPLLLPGLLDAARHNAARDMPELALFESAHVYAPAGDLGAAPAGSPRGAEPARERHHLAALLTAAEPGTWRSEPRPADYHAARGVLEGVLAAAGVEWTAEAAAEPFLHPGRSAAVVAGEQRIGWVGELHPLVARAWDIERAAAFELDAGLVSELAPGAAAYRDVTSFPAVHQDLAVVVPEEATAASVQAAVRRGAGELLASARVFDVYRGEQAGEGRKSLALRLELRAPDRTLADAEVAGLRAEIERELAEIGGRLRV